MATYVIGDIQGCFAELKLLLNKMNFQPQQDKLICLGDIVNRGPESLATLEFLADLPNCTVTLGNHDFHLLRSYYLGYQYKARDTIDKILQSRVVDNLCNWLRQQPVLLVDDVNKLIYSHAGIYPGVDLATLIKIANDIHSSMQVVDLAFYRGIFDNIPSYFTQELTPLQQQIFVQSSLTLMRYLNQDGSLRHESCGLSEAPKAATPWFLIQNPSILGYRVIFGHWSSLLGVTGQDNYICLDTGCVWGRQLTGMRIEDSKLYHINSI